MRLTRSFVGERWQIVQNTTRCLGLLCVLGFRTCVNEASIIAVLHVAKSNSDGTAIDAALCRSRLEPVWSSSCAIEPRMCLADFWALFWTLSNNIKCQDLGPERASSIRKIPICFASTVRGRFQFVAEPQTWDGDSPAEICACKDGDAIITNWYILSSWPTRIAYYNHTHRIHVCYIW